MFQQERWEGEEKSYVHIFKRGNMGGGGGGLLFLLNMLLSN